MFIGIDVSKKYLDIAIWKDGQLQEKPLHIENSIEAIQEFIQLLQSVELVVLESTGGYENLLVAELLTAGIPLSKVNPKRVRDFAKSIGKLAKTDTLDAVVLAQYAYLFSNNLVRASQEQNTGMKELCRLRQSLVGMKTSINNQLKMASNHTQTFLETTLTHLKEQIKELEQTIAGLLKQCPESHVLQAIPGIGAITSAVLLAELPELGRVSGKEIAALAGLAPFNVDSGQYRGLRRIWGGRFQARQALYMVVLVASRYNPVIKEYYERLKKRGKPSKVALTACMRKLLVILNAKMRDFYSPKIETTPLVKAA